MRSPYLWLSVSTAGYILEISHSQEDHSFMSDSAWNGPGELLVRKHIVSDHVRG